MPWMTGEGQHIPAGLSTPHPRLWSNDRVQIKKMCYNSENDENILLFRYFLLVDNNQSLEMSSMTGGGKISQPVYLPPNPRLWSSDCVQILKLLSSATLVRIS